MDSCPEIETVWAMNRPSGEIAALMDWPSLVSRVVLIRANGARERRRLQAAHKATAISKTAAPAQTRVRMEVEEACGEAGTAGGTTGAGAGAGRGAGSATGAINR